MKLQVSHDAAHLVCGYTNGPINNCAIHVPGVKFGHALGIDSLYRLTVEKPCHLKGKTCRKFKMDRILIILKKYDIRASSVLALGLYTIIFKHCLLVYVADFR